MFAREQGVNEDKNYAVLTDDGTFRCMKIAGDV
jgi:hypothetical protein